MAGDSEIDIQNRYYSRVLRNVTDFEKNQARGRKNNFLHCESFRSKTDFPLAPLAEVSEILRSARIVKFERSFNSKLRRETESFRIGNAF